MGAPHDDGFRFLALITAPPPPRPAWRCGSQSITANLTRFSPAGPMQAMRQSF